MVLAKGPMYQLTGYELQLRHLENCVLVSVHFLSNSDDFLLGNSDYWIWTPPWEKYVYLPSVIERLLGITMEQKLKKAKQRVSKAAEKQIAKHNVILNCLISE